MVPTLTQNERQATEQARPLQTDLEPQPSHEEQVERDREEGNQLIAGGAAVGAVGVAGAVLVGAACPLCVVAAPALLGAGLYRRWRAARTPARPERKQ